MLANFRVAAATLDTPLRLDMSLSSLVCGAHVPNMEREGVRTGMVVGEGHALSAHLRLRL